MIKRLLGGVVVVWLGVALPATYAQAPSTPIIVNPPTATPLPLPPTDLPTRTPTSLGPASAQALAEGTNVRAEPDISGERVGQISPMQSFIVIGKYFEWYQIQYGDTATGVAWVHQSVVQITGDENLIPDLSNQEIPTIAINPAVITEGEPLTSNSLDGQNAPQVNQQSVSMPTFTFPAITATPINLNDIGTRTGVSSSGGITPIMPILGLLGLGALGSLIAALRR